jgi:glycerate kinase
MPPPEKILIACDKFKGSLEAPAACAAIARGLAIRFPAALIEIHPIADGGEGFAASLAGPLSGRWIEVPAHDALGRPIAARYLLASTAGGPLAVMEMAEASGMWRIAPEDRDILRSSTFGTGEMMRHAILESGAGQLVIGLGGSATNDGGAGMAAALGARFLDQDGRELAPSPAGLAGRLQRIDTRGCLPLPPVTVACDVDSPLLGPAGATRVFGPQKGADATSIPLLENFLETLARVSAGEEDAQRPGAGAAGGLGFGLLHFAGARLVPGFDLLASLTGLEKRVAAADLIVTGEGSLDAQSLTGKGPVTIARLARGHGKPVIAFCGKADPAARDSGLFDSITELAATGLPIDQLMSRAADLMEEAARAASLTD